MPVHRPIILIVGPTAGGKTSLSLELAERLPGGAECISADSMQVYRGMDIGTAKPTPEERARAPHHLLDIVDPDDDSFTVDRWLALAENTIQHVRSRVRWPIVVGGTNLYVKALLEGLFEGPEPDAGLRAELEKRAAESLRTELERVDPAAARRIHPNDRRRTIRAIEVFELSGRPLSEHQRQWDRGLVRPDCLIIGLDYPRELINRRINARVRGMIESGLVEEVRRLESRGGLGRLASEAVGYREILAYFRQECTLEEATEAVKIRTRRYAKQQRTWLRRFRAYPRSNWLEVDGSISDSDADRLCRWALQAASEASGRDQPGT